MRSRDSVKGKKQASRRRGVLVATLAMAVILLATLWPLEPRGAKVPILCLLCGDRGLADGILNLALFVPLGVGLVLAGARPAAAVAIGLATTIGVEALQVNVVPGRDASLGDVLSNTLGTLAGAVTARHAAILLFPAPGAAARWAAVTGGGATLILGLTAWLLGFSLPEATWYGQWAPHLGQYERFPGTIQAAELNGEPLPPGKLRDTPERIARLREEGTVELRVDFTPAGPTLDLAPVVSVFDEQRRKVLLLGQDGRSLRFEVRTRAEAVGFRSPAAIIDAPGWNETEPSRAEGLADARGMHLTLVQGERRWSARTPHSAAVGWMFLNPFEGPRNAALVVLFGGLWAVVLWIPWGYYWRRARAATGASLRSPLEWVGLAAPLIVFGLASLAGWGTWGPASALGAGPIGAFLGMAAADAAREAPDEEPP